MHPVIAIVGRPNTGKSTLFNRITGTRNALIADMPGVTRDRNYSLARHDGHQIIVVDTGGLNDYSSSDQAISELVSQQSIQAIREADIIFWVLDGPAGLTPGDENLTELLRPFGKKLYLLINKTEGMDEDMTCAEFYHLGMGTPYAISAQKGYGIESVLDLALADFSVEPVEEETSKNTRIAVIGRPNVGKSTLINRMTGENRVLTFDKPGTTRDSILIPFSHHNRQYELVDTAGVRRRSKLSENIEKISVIKTLQAIESANIIITVIDASEALTDQDLHLLGLTVQSGKPLIIAANKWDNLEQHQREMIKNQMDRKLAFVDYACFHFISALHGTGVGDIFKTVNKIEKCINKKIQSSELTDLLSQAVEAHAPPLRQGRRIKLRYAHIGGHNPLRIIVHGNQTSHVPDFYSRYLSNFFRRRLRLTGTPVFIQYKYGDNPYRHKRNVLTERQLKRRQRVIRFSKK
jgi:GTP-binding protein